MNERTKAPSAAVMKAIAALQDRLDHDERAREADPDSKRTFRRWPYRVGAVPVGLAMTNGATTETAMVTRDISPKGVGLLHTSYAHLGTVVTLSLPLPGGGVSRLTGVVVRCAHVAGVVHYLGVALEREIDPSRYEPSISTGQRLAREGRVTGAVLHVEDCAIDRELLRRALDGSGLKLVSVPTLDEAARRSRAVWSVIISDQRLPDGLGSDLVTRLRAEGSDVPFVVLTADDSQRMRDVLAGCPADAVMYKPIDPVALRASITSLAISPPQDGATSSTLAVDRATGELVNAYVLTLRTQGRQLQRHWETRDVAACLAIGREIAGSAEPYGFAAIGAQATHMCELLAADDWTVDAAAAVRRLMTLCQQVRTVAARGEDTAA